jgi:hypothetical protein
MFNQRRLGCDYNTVNDNNYFLFIQFTFYLIMNNDPPINQRKTPDLTPNKVPKIDVQQTTPSI